MRRPVLAFLGAAAALAAAPAASNAAVTNTFTDGHLQITATGADDITIGCELAGTQLTVNSTPVNGATGCNAVKSIDIKGGDGDTTITLTSVGATLFDEEALYRKIFIDSGTGNDLVNGSPLHERVVARGSGLQLVDNGPDQAKIRTIETNDVDILDEVDAVELQGTDGPDYLETAAYSNGPVYAHGNGGDDELLAPMVNNSWRVELHGGTGNDTFHGGPDGEALYGDDGNDTIAADGGDDEINPGGGTDTVDGGSGTDELQDALLGAQVTLTPSSYTDDASTASLSGVENARLFDPFERVSATRLDATQWSGRLIAAGRGGDDVLLGGVGNNDLTGGEGHDRLVGGPQDDVLLGLGDNDYLEGGGGTDELDGSSGSDEIRSIDGLADKVVDCGSEQDVLRGDAADIAIGVSCETATDAVPTPPGEPKPDEPKPMDPKPMDPKPMDPLPQPPADKTAPKLKLGKGSLSKKGVYTIKVTCPAGEVSCSGSATLASARKIGKRKVTFGKKSFNVSGGKSATLKIKLSKKNLKLLRQKRKIAAKLAVTARDAAGNRGGASARVSLRAAR